MGSLLMAASAAAFIVIDRITNSTVAAGMILDKSGDGEQKSVWDDEVTETGKTDDGSVGRMVRFRAQGDGNVDILTTLVTDISCPAIVAGDRRDLGFAGVVGQRQQAQGLGGRGGAMGETGVATALDATAVYWNPAQSCVLAGLALSCRSVHGPWPGRHMAPYSL